MSLMYSRAPFVPAGLFVRSSLLAWLRLSGEHDGLGTNRGGFRRLRAGRLRVRPRPLLLNFFFLGVDFCLSIATATFASCWFDKRLVGEDDDEDNTMSTSRLSSFFRARACRTSSLSSFPMSSCSSSVRSYDMILALRCFALACTSGDLTPCAGVEEPA